MLNEKILNAAVKAESCIQNVKEKVNKKVKGAFAFEYVIVLAIMVVIIITAWNILSPAVMAKVNTIAQGIQNNTGTIPGFNPGP